MQARLDELGVEYSPDGKPLNACFATHPTLKEDAVRKLIDALGIPWHLVGTDERGVHVVRMLPADVGEFSGELCRLGADGGWLMSNGPALKAG